MSRLLIPPGVVEPHLAEKASFEFSRQDKAKEPGNSGGGRTEHSSICCKPYIAGPRC